MIMIALVVGTTTVPSVAEPIILTGPNEEKSEEHFVIKVKPLEFVCVGTHFLDEIKYLVHRDNEEMSSSSHHPGAWLPLDCWIRY